MVPAQAPIPAGIKSSYFFIWPSPRGTRWTSATKWRSSMTRRKDRQPYEMPSAGSVFKRPEGYYAGTLIEQCGLKGCQIGGRSGEPQACGLYRQYGRGLPAGTWRPLLRKFRKPCSGKPASTLECEVRRAASCRTQARGGEPPQASREVASSRSNLFSRVNSLGANFICSAWGMVLSSHSRFPRELACASYAPSGGEPPQASREIAASMSGLASRAGQCPVPSRA